jgi:micrococcal nuclease
VSDFKTNRTAAVTVFTLLLGYSLCGCAEIFKWQDSAGATHYSDRAANGAQALAIRPEYTFTAVEKIYDGDTILLQDGRKVRLLGINTPEIAHRGNPAEAGGMQAKTWLENYLQGKKVRLQGDAEKQDKYGRTLAYVFTEDGAQVNLELAKQGLAAVVVHPPNLLYAEPLLAAQRQAESGKLGIWKAAEYAAMPATTLDRDNSRGWRRLTGRVTDIHRSRKYVYLEIAPQLSARIAVDDLAMFGDLEAYRGKHVEIRGWLSRSQDRYIMPLRHPSAIIKLP